MLSTKSAPHSLGWFVGLFIALMACIVVYPQLHGLIPGVVERVCWQLTLVCALLALATRWSELGVIAALLALDSWMAGAGGTVWPACGQAVDVGVRAYVIYRITRFVFSGEVTANSLFAAVCVYLMIGFFFGQIFCLVDGLGGKPPLLNVSGQPPSTEETFYFSFSALTTAGFGDVRPATPLARSVTTVETLTGQLYLILLLGRLVGLHLSRPATGRKAKYKRLRIEDEC